MDSNKFIEIKKPVEEVREVEEVKLETPLVEKTEASFEKSDRDDEKEEKEGVKEVLGTELEIIDAAAPPVGFVESTLLGTAGEISEGIGKITGDQDAKDFGEISKDSAGKGVKDVGKGIKKIGKGIKEAFED